MIRAASRHAMADLRQHLEESTARTSAGDLTSLAGELYAVAALFVGEPRLRRTLGDPSTDPEARAGLVASLLQGQVSARGLDVVQAAARLRWSSPWDLTDALELAGDDALMHA